MTFFEYMMRNLKRNSPAGYLARDINYDKDNFPKSNDWKVVMDYLFSKDACSECFETFEKCYARYVQHEIKRYRIPSDD